MARIWGGVVVYFFVEAADQQQVRQLIETVQKKVQALALVKEAEVETFRSGSHTFHLTVDLALRQISQDSTAFHELVRACNSGFSLPSAEKIRLQPYLARRAEQVPDAEPPN